MRMHTSAVVADGGVGSAARPVGERADVRRAGADRGAAGLRLSTEAWESLFRAQVGVMRRLAQDAVWDEVTLREYDVLYQVARAGGDAVRLRDLNEHILLSQPSLSRMVERLESRGLVVRDRAADDARGVTVRLTPEGERLQRRVGLAHVRAIQLYVGGALSVDDLETLRDLCSRLLEAQASIPDLTRDPRGPHAPAARSQDASARLVSRGPRRQLRKKEQGKV